MSSDIQSATTRFGLTLAPEGLAVVQELVNSGAPAGVDRDPLRSIETAGPWLEATVSAWAVRAGQEQVLLHIVESDLPHLARIRESVRDWLAGQDDPHSSPATAEMTLRPGRTVAYGPGGTGPAGLESIAAVELLLAARRDRSRRLKVCANPACGAAFYDESPNATRRWHDVKTCGNVANLRASRARKRSSADGGAIGDGQ